MAQAAPPRERPTTWCFALRLQMQDFSTVEEVRVDFAMRSAPFSTTRNKQPWIGRLLFFYGVKEGGFTHIRELFLASCLYLAVGLVVFSIEK